MFKGTLKKIIETITRPRDTFTYSQSAQRVIFMLKSPGKTGEYLVNLDFSLTKDIANLEKPMVTSSSDGKPKTWSWSKRC